MYLGCCGEEDPWVGVAVVVGRNGAVGVAVEIVVAGGVADVRHQLQPDLSPADFVGSTGVVLGDRTEGYEWRLRSGGSSGTCQGHPR